MKKAQSLNQRPKSNQIRQEIQVSSKEFQPRILKKMSEKSPKWSRSMEAKKKKMSSLTPWPARHEVTPGLKRGIGRNNPDFCTHGNVSQTQWKTR